MIVWEASAYSSLKSLECDGLVTSRKLSPPSTGGRPPVVYTIKPSGRALAKKHHEEAACLFTFFLLT